MTITVRQLRGANFIQVYSYDGTSTSFVTFACDAIPGLTLTHEKRKGSKKIVITYQCHGRKTDSPSQAVKFYNRVEKNVAQS